MSRRARMKHCIGRAGELPAIVIGFDKRLAFDLLTESSDGTKHAREEQVRQLVLAADAHEVDGVFKVAALNQVRWSERFDCVLKLVELSEYRHTADFSFTSPLSVQNGDGFER